MARLLIFTDLDGTLLDHRTYSFDPALPALSALKEREIPLILCSSKTRREIEYYRKKLTNTHPFISENGGGIFIPKDYFALGERADSYPVEEDEGYAVIRLGAPYSDLRDVIQQLQRDGFRVRGFGDMKPEELAGIAHMNIDEALMAKERDFDEPFMFEGDRAETGRLLSSITARGFHHTRGRFFHILGNSDKGKAVTILTELFRKKFGDMRTVALGDSPNDVPMLRRVDYPIVVQKPDATYEPQIDLPHLVRAEGIGPVGWNRTVLHLLKQYAKT